jgi:4-diphosphocytidyl-2-C-methyl-D-erythritol kinase
MSVESITVSAHAKINLVLRVLEREGSGYHRIETLFQRIALADDIAIRIGGASRSLDVKWAGAAAEDLGPVEQNLAWRAAEEFAAVAKWPTNWSIEITKRIPARAGLGGGSADAAAVLRALDALAPTRQRWSRLLEIAARLGADVPFLLSGHSLAIGRRYGAAIEPVPALPPAAVVLLVPSFGVSTSDAYAELARFRQVVGAAVVSPDLTTHSASSWAAVASIQANDFEPTVIERHPALAAALDALSDAGATISRLCGSGSAVFGLREEPANWWPPTLDGFRAIPTTTL